MIPDLDFSVIEGNHPRILVEEDDFEKIRNRQWDPLGQRYWEFIQFSGTAMLKEEPVKRELTGHRMLQQSRRALKHILTWTLLYRVEGNPKFRDRAIAEMESIAAFTDWNPRHYLDVGEMALALAIGTDWLWEELTEEQKDRYLDALETKGILPSLDEDHIYNWWIYYYNNWNPVCHSGIIAAALMISERNPELAEKVIHRAIRAFPETLTSYQPDGAYPEGPVYWDYGTLFSGIVLNLLDTAFGTKFGLDEDPAFRASATFRALAVTPTGKFYNYADCHETDRFAIVTAWFAREYGNAAAYWEMRRGLSSLLDRNEWTAEDSKGRLLPILALWYPSEMSMDSEADLPTTWLGRGPNPVALVRENWEDPNAFFLGFKGNDCSVSHAHMDGGSFILEDEGIRWAIDLGSQGYNSLEKTGLGLWDRRQHSDRWRVFRLGPDSHNILLIDERPRNADTKGDIVHFEDTGDSIHGIVDLTPLIPGQAKSYHRHFMVHDFKVLEIVDEVVETRHHTGRQGTASSSLRWRMATRAAVTIDGDSAILEQDGKTLYLKVVAPENFTLRSTPIDAPRRWWDEPNPGVSAIDLWTHTEHLTGNQTIRILMSTDAAALETISR
ncbi:MAG: heparinase II/III family protein [Puniceicoccaceae bacterium]